MLGDGRSWVLTRDGPTQLYKKKGAHEGYFMSWPFESTDGSSGCSIYRRLLHASASASLRYVEVNISPIRRTVIERRGRCGVLWLAVVVAGGGSGGGPSTIFVFRLDYRVTQHDANPHV